MKGQGRVDECDLELVWLERYNDCAGVEAQGLGEVSATDAPQLACGDGSLLDVGDHISGPIDLVGGNELAAQFCNSLHQVMTTFDGVERAWRTCRDTGALGNRRQRST